MSTQHTVEHRIGSGPTERFIIFAGYQHETCGGAADIVDSVSTLAKAHDFVDAVMQDRARPFFDYDWCQILDTQTGNFTEFEKIEPQEQRLYA